MINALHYISCQRKANRRTFFEIIQKRATFVLLHKIGAGFLCRLMDIKMQIGILCKPFKMASCMFFACFAPFGRGVTERNTSLHSGSIDSVQNGEAKLHRFEAQKRKLKLSH